MELKLNHIEIRLVANEGVTHGVRDSFAQGKGSLGLERERRAWF